MDRRKLGKIIVFLCAFTGLIFLNSPVLASITDGTINQAYKYAWSDQIGWINFGATEGNVHITDYELTGYLWASNYGWIDLSPTTSGVENDREGALSGYAWGEDTGWINFDGVTINSQGFFTGTATGDIVGTINFNCDNCTVKTDWTPKATRETFGGPTLGVSSPPSFPYTILINEGAQKTNSQIVALRLSAGGDVKRVEISNFPNFPNAIKEIYESAKSWDLCAQKDDLCRDVVFPATGLTFTVYARFYTLFDQPSDVVSASIIFDKQPPGIEITDIKAFYTTDENIIISGLCEPGLEFLLNYNDRYGIGYVDNQGHWSFNLGKLQAGNYELKISTKDVVGNASELKGNIAVKAKEIEPILPPLSPVTKVIDKIQDVWDQIISKILPPKVESPKEIVTIPKETPLSLRGQWQIMPRKEINSFVFQPLPREITSLAKKFSSLQKTLEDLGISKAIDIDRMRSTTLTLPGLTELSGISSVVIRPGEIVLPKGIPIANLTDQAKSRIPTEIVFARTANELIDFNISLSLNEKGQPQQIIGTVVDKPLELVVKPENPVKRIRGYVIFKAKRSQPSSFVVPLESLAASLFLPVSISQAEPIDIEEEFVLLEFEYTDPDGDGIYTASIQSPMVDGEYEIITVMDYENLELGSKLIRMITVVDPEGYVYEKTGDKETRINKATVFLYWLNPETKQYELWLAKEYNQENPQITDVRGTYSFLVPGGYYYLKIDADGYSSYDGKPFEVRQGSAVHINIELKAGYWWIKYIMDWRNIIFVIVIIFLLYNFYRDLKRDKIKNINNIKQN